MQGLEQIIDRLGARCLSCGRWLAGLMLVLVAAQPAQAVLVSVGDAIGVGWVVDSIDAGVTLDFTSTVPASGAMGNSSTRGFLLVDVGHVDFTARKFRLRQTTALADISTSAATGGLRLLMSVIAANNGILPWAGYVISALDQSHVDAAGNNIDDHKQDAHFHDSPKGFDSTPLALKGIGDNVYDLTYGLGTIVEVDELFKADNILLHERFFAGTQRVFDISLRPVPEPGTLWLAGPLLLLLLHGRRRLQRASA